MESDSSVQYQIYVHLPTIREHLGPIRCSKKYTNRKLQIGRVKLRRLPTSQSSPRSQTNRLSVSPFPFSLATSHTVHPIGGHVKSNPNQGGTIGERKCGGKKRKNEKTTTFSKPSPVGQVHKTPANHRRLHLVACVAGGYFFSRLLSKVPTLGPITTRTLSQYAPPLHSPPQQLFTNITTTQCCELPVL